MPTDSPHRSVTIQRTAAGHYTATNSRGSTLDFSTGDAAEFTPVELLLVAIGGCSGVDVDLLTSRRAEPEAFTIQVDADKVRDGSGNHLDNIEVSFRLRFPAGDAGDAARAVLPDAVQKSHDRLCTVSRTVELGTPVATRIE